MIINAKLEDGNNYLHSLINKLSPINYEDVSEMIKAMLVNGCNPNHSNDKAITPFYLLLNKLSGIKADSDLITFCVAHTNIDFYSHNSDDVIRMMQERGLQHKIVPPREPVVDVNFMIQHLDNKNESGFVSHMENFRSSSRYLLNDLARLLEAAVVRNLSRFAELLIDEGADVNGSDSANISPSPAYLACTNGNHQVLKVLLKSPKLKFKCDKARSSLLHQIFLSKSIHHDDRQKCFDLIITDRRCTLEIINGEDSKGQTPLFLACHYGYDDVAKELMRRGAYIGHEPIINNIDNKVLKDFLDECIKCSSEVSDKSCEIHVDYRFLIPPDIQLETHSEMTAVHEIAGNSKIKDLILHPVISSYLKLKWKQIDLIVYFNLLVYFFFMLFLGVFVINYFRDSVYSKREMNNIYGDDSSLEAGIRNAFPPPPPVYAHDIPEYPHDVPAFASAPPVWSTLGLDDPESRQNNMQGAFGNGFGGGFDASKFPATETTHSSDNPEFRQKENFPLDPTTPRTTTLMHSRFGESDVRVTSEQTPSETPQPKRVEFEPPSILSLIFGIKSEKRSKRSTDDDPFRMYKTRFENHFEDNALSYRICLLGVLLMTIYEIVQCYSSWRKYFFKLSNWLDIALIFLSYVVLIGSFKVEPEDFKRVRAIMILVMAAQSIQLVAKVSILSMSLHMAIFKRVCATFLKTISLYLIMILAFAMSFYTMNDVEENANLMQPPDGGDDDNAKSFSDPFMSVITTVRMMLSDFDTIKLKEKDRFQGAMFLLFVILITVVLYNLLNALAISDTNNIIKDAELVDTKKRISILYSYEKLFFYLSPSFINILPRMSTIMLTPNSDDTIKVKRSFGSKRDVSVLIHKTAKPQKFEILTTRKWMFWKDRPLRLSRKFMTKFVDFVRAQQDQRIEDSERKLLTEKIDVMTQELISVKSTQSTQCETMESLVRLLCRREKFLEDSKSEKFKTIQTDELFM